MTPDAPPDSEDPSSWLVEELVAPGAEPPAPPAADEDWGAGLPAEETPEPEPEPEAEGASDSPPEAEDTNLADEIREHAKALDRRQSATDDALLAFSSRLDTLEERLRSLAADSESVQETISVLARYRPHDLPASEDESEEVTALDLNSASFEDLRRIGLSATQAARVLSHRDGMGGYDTVERLREVPGLSEKLVERIGSRTRV